MARKEEGPEVWGWVTRKEGRSEVLSWGAGTNGQLGTGHWEDSHKPKSVACLSGSVEVLEIACGGSHVLAIVVGVDGECQVASWGWGVDGALGHGDHVSLASPRQVAALRAIPIRHVAAGWSHSVFLSASGQLYACGDGAFGQLGLGDRHRQITPRHVSSLAAMNVISIACGLRHTLAVCTAVDAEGNPTAVVFGWGATKCGQLAIPPPPRTADNPSTLVDLPRELPAFQSQRVISVYAGGEHSAALTEDGEILVWGRAFGDRRKGADILSPLRMGGGAKWCQLALGWNHALALSDAGHVWAWGSNRHGQLGIPRSCAEPDAKSPEPGGAEDGAPGEARGVSHEGERHSVEGAGGSVGRHLAGVPEDLRMRRVHFEGGARAVWIAAGAEHSHAVLDDGTVLGWGWGEHGQVGHGGTNDAHLPTAINLVGCSDLQEAPRSPQVSEASPHVRIFSGSGFAHALVSPSNRRRGTNIKDMNEMK